MPLSQRRSRREFALAVAFAVLGLVPLLPGRAHAATRGIERVGTLPISLGEEVVPDGMTRRLLTIGSGVGELTIRVFDADRLKLRRSVTLPPYWAYWGGNGKPLVYVFDEKARRLHLIAYTSQQALDLGVDPHFLTIHADSLEVLSDRSLATVIPAGFSVLGLTAQESGPILAVAQALPTARTAGVLVTEIDPASGTATWGPNVVRGCQAAITNYSQSAAVSTEQAVFVGCAAAQFASNLPAAQAVAAVGRADPNDQRLAFLPGTYANGDVYADVKAGRLLLVGPAPGSPAQAVWVFDIAQRVFVGQVAPGDLSVNGAGLNPVNGRLYMGVTGALLVTSGRGFSIPQALSFPVDTNPGPIVSVPFNSTIVVPIRGPFSSWIFVVYRDALPRDAFVPARPNESLYLDRLTTDTPQYSADAQAFGLRIHRIGGVNNALQNVFPIPSNYWSTLGNNTGLKDGDRDLHFSRIVRAYLSQDEASAGAISLARDASTESDYGTIRSRADSVPEWQYNAASCRDFGGSPKQDEAQGAISGTLAGRAFGNCSLASKTSEASASFGGVTATGLFSVGSSSSGATLRLDPKLGLVADVFAEARNITITPADNEDVVQIGRVRSEVLAAASGIPNKAAGAYRRIFEGVTAGDFRCGMSCDPTEAAAAIAEQLGTPVRVELPAADELATPGGAHGHALRDAWQHQQDVVINNQEETELQVPALRLTFVNDKSLASRLIVEFAATKADATSFRVVPGRPGFEQPAVVVPPAPLPPATLPPVIAPKPKSLAPPGIVEQVVKTLGHGWKFLLTGRPTMIVRSIALWVLFVSPLFFAVRRRLLRRLEGMTS